MVDTTYHYMVQYSSEFFKREVFFQMNIKRERLHIVIAGLIIGVIASLLVFFGNPANMGFCIACFLRDTAGGLGLHRAAAVQYIRPEIIGLVLGSFGIALFKGEFSAKGGSAPLTRFVLGFFVMIGCLMFLGCPFRMILRLAGGDLNALLGGLGFVLGILAGVFFLKKGYSLKRSYSMARLEGFLFPAIQVVVFILLVAAPAFIYFTEAGGGPGAKHAAVLISLAAGLIVGALAQRTRLCMVGGIRDVVLFREPKLLMGFGAILVNLPSSGVLNQMVEGIGESQGIIQWLFETTIEASEALPLLLFIGIGAMIDFGPLLSNPKMLLFGAAAQFGIFFTMVAAVLLGFDLADAASIGIIGAADGPTSILVSQVLHSSYVGPIAVAAYSYMALVPIIQPFAIKLVTTKKERRIRMPYNPKNVSRTLRICFPILVTIIAGFIAPMSVSLVGFLMFGNLLRECGCLDRLSETAQNTLANLITLLLGITISFSMRADQFVNRNTLIIMGLGLVAFVFDSIAGVMFAKLLNLFSKKKVNPMVGAAGISAFPMSARVIQKMGLEADPQNHLLMHAVGANVAGQIASVLAGGMILNLVPQLLK